MLKAVIFDMDGVLIDSEPLWRKALATVFSSMGYSFKEEMGIETMGTRIDQAVVYWHRKFGWTTPPLPEVENRIMKEVERLIILHGKAKEGVKEVLKFFHGQKLKVALASSAHMHLIRTVLRTLKIEYYFDEVHSAEYEKHPKPAPDVYLTTAKELGIKPSECLVIEDSPVGVAAGKYAGMVTIAIPSPGVENDPRIRLADYRFSSMKDITGEFWDKINSSI